MLHDPGEHVLRGQAHIVWKHDVVCRCVARFECGPNGMVQGSSKNFSGRVYGHQARRSQPDI
jgi:hypothetical protein